MKSEVGNRQVTVTTEVLYRSARLTLSVSVQLFAKQSEVANTRMRELEAEIHKMSMNGEKELMALKIELERLRIRYVFLTSPLKAITAACLPCSRSGIE